MLPVISMIFLSAAFFLSVIIAFTPVEYTYSLKSLKRGFRITLIFGIIILAPAIYLIAKSEEVTTCEEKEYLDATKIVFQAGTSETEILLKTDLDSYIPQVRCPIKNVKLIPMPYGSVKIVTNSTKRTCNDFTLDVLTGLEFVNMKYTIKTYDIYYPTGIKVVFP